MGCCTSSNAQKPKDKIIDKKKVNEVKERLQSMKMQTSQTPMSDETLQLLQKAKVQPFNCRFISLLHVHNYLMFLRDKSVSSIKDANQLVLLDIRGTKSSDYHDNVRIFKSEWFDIREFEEKLITKSTNDKSEFYVSQKLKLYVSMKYLFVVGG